MHGRWWWENLKGRSVGRCIGSILIQTKRNVVVSMGIGRNYYRIFFKIGL